MATDRNLREHLIWLLEGGAAHIKPEQALNNFPASYYGAKLGKLPHTPWQILENMRIVQWDVLQFCLKPEHVSPKFPQGYWPQSPKPKDPADWQLSVDKFHKDRLAMIDLAKNPEIDLLLPIPHGSGQAYIREILLVADHNSYHLGQLVLIRRILGVWP